MRPGVPRCLSRQGSRVRSAAKHGCLEIPAGLHRFEDHDEFAVHSFMEQAPSYRKVITTLLQAAAFSEAAGGSGWGRARTIMQHTHSQLNRTSR